MLKRFKNYTFDLCNLSILNIYQNWKKNNFFLNFCFVMVRIPFFNLIGFYTLQSIISDILFFFFTVNCLKCWFSGKKFNKSEFLLFEYVWFNSFNYLFGLNTGFIFLFFRWPRIFLLFHVFCFAFCRMKLKSKEHTHNGKQKNL